MIKTPYINVGIIRQAVIKFRFSGKFYLSGTSENYYDACEASIEKGKIRIDTGGIHKLHGEKATFIPCNLFADLFELTDVLIGIDFHWEQKENQKFQGALKLLAMGDEIQVVNVLPVENYINSVISSEMSADSSLNLLKAHAVISRSWALKQINTKYMEADDETRTAGEEKSESEFIQWYDHKDHKHFDVCADDHCQRYQGLARAQNSNVIRAVKETYGQVLTYENEICDARYSKSCGGVSETFENCWDPVPHPYLKKVIDRPAEEKGEVHDLRLENNARSFIEASPVAFCNTSDRSLINQVLNDYDRLTEDFFRWEITYTQDEISAIILEKSGMDFGKIIDLVPVERGESGRLVRLHIEGTKRGLTIGKELTIRKWLSRTHLYSSAIIIEKLEGENDLPIGFRIRGAGWGHGVGLCQIGAAVMGEKGYTAEEILNHYYPGANIEKIYT